MSAGKRIGSGHLRVDAAKAIAKLRDYQLPDPLQWVLECFRGAVGLGAEAAFAWGDADDVWLAWRGKAPDPEELAKLLDVLVSPQTRGDRRWARLFAIGVNTALGLAPRFVDLWSLPASTENESFTSRVRYSPALLAGDGERLRELAPERMPAPPELIRALGDRPVGGAVQLRRTFGIDVMGRYFSGREADELERLRRATRDARLPVHVGGRLLEAPRDLVRIPLGPGLEGFVAVTSEPGSRAGITLDVAERGAVLQELVMQFPGVDAPRRAVPLRIHVDAERLPTNAARSAVRLDERPLSELPSRVEKILPELVQTLVERAPIDDAARTAAIRLLASACAGANWAFESRLVPPMLTPLAELPILRDAVGRPRSFTSFPGGDVVHTGTEPYPTSLAPWLGDFVHAPPGDPVLELFGDTRVRGAEAAAKEARRHLAVREAWLSHPTREPRVEAGPGQLVALRFGEEHGAPRRSAFVRQLTPKGVRGEIVLLDPSTLGTRRAALGELHLLLEGRPIATAQIEAPWPWVGIVEADFVPQPDYRGILLDAVYQNASNAAQAAVLEAVEVLAHGLLRASDRWPKQAELRTSDLASVLSPPETKNALFDRTVAIEGSPFAPAILSRLRECQAAIANLLEAGSTEQLVAAFKDSALARLPLWPLDDGVDAVRWWPLRKLLAESRGAERTVRLRVPTSYRARRRFPRAAFRVEGTDLVALRRLLPNLELVEYEPGRGEEILPARLAARFAMSSEVVALVDREDQHRRGVVVLTQREPELVIHHRGQRVERRPFQPTLLPCRIGIDDDLVVPNPVYTATILDSPHPLRTEEWERALLDALIDGLGGGDSALFDARGLETLDWIRDALIVGLERRRLEALDEARRAKIEAYPLVSRAYGERLSLHELREEKGPLVWVLADVRVDRDLDWNPILANEDTARAIGRLVARRVVDGRSELDRRRRDVDRLRRETAIRRGSTPPPPEAGAGSVALTGTIAGAAAYGVLRFAPSRFVQGLRVDLRIEGHAYRMHDLPSAVPLEAAIDLPMDALGAERSGLLPSVEAEIAGACQRALGPLLVEVGSQTPARLLEDPLVARALETYVASGIRKGSKVAAKLCAIPAFRTVQGDLASIDDASTHSRVRVAEHSGGWLGPVDDDDRHTLDKPVLLVGESGGLRDLIEKLAAPKGLLDHTRAVRTLQAERRVRQGVVSAPTLTDVAVGLKATVRDLSPRKRIPSPLGPGEIGLVERGPTQAGVFSNGRFVAWLPLSVSPPIRAVMEVPALVEDAQRMPASTGSRLSEPLTSLTGRLIREQIVPRLDEHPAWVRHSVRRAFASKMLDAKDLDGAAIFETTSDRWIGTRELYEQANTYGEVWYTSRTSVRDRARLPLDEARLVLRLDADEVGNLSQRVTLYDAAERLVREDQARQNLAKPRVTELFFSTRVRPHLIAETKFGRGKRHGVVGLLVEPSDLAGIHLFREGVSLGISTTGFDWPLVALVESDKLTPNETWDAAVEDSVVVGIRNSVAKAAEALLAELGACELDALRTAAIEARHSSALGGPGAVRGRVGLRRELAPGRVTLRVNGRTEHLDPDIQPGRGGPRRTIPIEGVVLASMQATAAPSSRINAALRTLYGELISGLVHDLRGERVAGDDLVLAHVVRAVSLGVHVPTPADVGITIPCFHPRPLTLPQLRDLFAREDAVPVRKPGKLPKKLVALLADGSRTSEQVELALGPRARHAEPVELVTEEGVAAEHAAHVVETEPAARVRETRPENPKPFAEPPPKKNAGPAKEASPPREVAKPHALAPLAEHLLAQLAALGLPERVAHVRLDDRQKPMAKYRSDERTLWLSGTHAQLVALQAARLSRSADAERAMRVLVAHVVGVLDRASAAVTEATQLGALGTLMTA
ncbi:MAG: hypothetical protein H6721_21020 [Sandaracinus sp.]|nr:hypothetical protein [Sandaracinus sp.]MCB9634615.1 hypothetical protein [Sandaracinus sp.]